MRIFRQVLFVFAALMVARATSAQVPVTATDLTRLETMVSDIRRDVETVRGSDPTLATEVDRALADLSDEVTYLRVKMRREGAVTREEYSSLRDRLETLRVRAQGQKVSAQPVLNDVPSRGGVVPAGSELDVRLQTSLNSATAKVEQRFEATTILDYAIGENILIPAGSTVRGFVSSVKAAGHIDRRGSLTLSFDEIRINGRSYRLRGTVTQALDPKMSQDATRIGVGAVAGAILGGLIGGGKGALLGVLVGGGGTMAATEGADVDLPAGTILRIRLDQRLDVASSM